jgi:hypothetical protein
MGLIQTSSAKATTRDMLLKASTSLSMPPIVAHK